MAKSKVVIIGGFGVVGSSLIGQLLLQEKSNELEIHVVTRTAGRQIPALWNSNTVLHVHQLDIFNTDQVSSFLKEIRAKYLVHLAWVTTHGKYWNDPELEINWPCADPVLSDRDQAASSFSQIKQLLSE